MDTADRVVRGGRDRDQLGDRVDAVLAADAEDRREAPLPELCTEVASVVGITAVSQESLEAGFRYYLQVLAFISLSLALLNLLPLLPGSVTNVGGSQAHTNMAPYLVINFCIALQGVFPARP